MRRLYSKVSKPRMIDMQWDVQTRQRRRKSARDEAFIHVRNTYTLARRVARSIALTLARKHWRTGVEIALNLKAPFVGM